MTLHPLKKGVFLLGIFTCSHAPFGHWFWVALCVWAAPPVLSDIQRGAVSVETWNWSRAVPIWWLRDIH